MIRRLTLRPLAVVVCLAATAAPASAQLRGGLRPRPVAQVAVVSQADLRGVVVDEEGQPLACAVVSALGSTTAFAVSDRDGRFAVRNLPSGPYLVRAHLQGYVPARARMIQVDQSSRNLSTIALTRHADGEGPPEVLAAGVGPADAGSSTAGDAETHDHGEVAWRLRHLKRSVLKDATTGVD